MKWFFIFPFLILQFLALAQENNSAIIASTDKAIYQIGDTINIHISSEHPFTLATDGDCGSSILSPTYIKEIDGQWQEAMMVKQMACGLPCTMESYQKVNFQMLIQETGKHKAVIYTCSGIVISDAFEIQDHKNAIIATTDKTTYQIGDTINIHVSSKKPFALSTNGDCNSSALSPIYIKEMDGQWQEPMIDGQMDCGLPCTMEIYQEIDFQMVIPETGKYKVIILICFDTVVSNEFEIKAE